MRRGTQRAVWVAGIGLAVACTRANPAFDGGSAGESSASSGLATAGEGGTIADDTLGGGSHDGSEGPAAPCTARADCDDGVFCNGAETCKPVHPNADDRGCVEGSPPCADGATCSEDMGVCITDCPKGTDADRDGHDAVECGGTDCNDSNPDVFVGATEVCDEANVDEDCDPRTVGELDADGDSAVSSACCNQGGDGAVHCGPDCDDSQPGIAGPGDWAHCQACNTPCEVAQACEAGACIAARRVFATSTTQSGDLGGLEGADSLCQTLADGALLGGTFRAYMVGPTQGLNRLEHPNVPFVRLDGVRVANSWNDLADATIAAPINRDEWRIPVTGNAWTGLNQVNGNPLNNHCTNWTFEGGGCLGGGPCGAAGETEMIDGHWDGWFVFDCSTPFRLYCIEQSPD